MAKNVHSGHRQRVYENFIRADSLDGFSDIEIVEMILFYGIRQRDTNVLAHKVIDCFGNIQSLLSSLPSEIIKRTNLSTSAACILSASGKYSEIISLNNKIKFTENIDISMYKRDYEATGSFRNFNEFQILMFFLHFCIYSSSIENNALEIIDRISLLRELFMMHPSEILQTFKCNRQTACLFALPYEIEKRYNLSKFSIKQSINSIETAINHLMPYFMDKTKEYFYMICLDKDKSEIRTVCLSRGNSTYADVDIKTLVNAALQCKADAVIISHNHPSGKCEPSAEDLKLTNAILAALKIVHIKLVDHIIAAGNTFYSFSAENMFGLSCNYK